MPAYPSVEYVLTSALGDAAADTYVRRQRRDLRRKLWKPLGGFLLYAVVCGAALFVTRGGAGDRFRSTMTVLLGVVGGFFVLMVALHVLFHEFVRWLRSRQLREAYLSATDPTVRWTFTDEGFETRLSERTRTLPWADVRSFREAPGFWIIGVPDGMELFLPLEFVPDVVAALIREKLAGLGLPATASAG